MNEGEMILRYWTARTAFESALREAASELGPDQLERRLVRFCHRALVAAAVRARPAAVLGIPAPHRRR